MVVDEGQRPPGYGRALPVFTVDVEDWFQVSAFDRHVARGDWNSLAARVEHNTDRLLQICSDTSTQGTFFTLGWVAERYPALLRRIVDAGHEIASHGYGHQRITTITPSAFREDVRDAKHALEDATGQLVTGYRAPSFSLTDDVPWAAAILVEEGHAYDSSRFPISRPGYGTAKGARVPHVLHTTSGPLMEYPPAVWPVAGLQIPVAGGGWFRQFPDWVIQSGLSAVMESEQPAVFYIHPWEIDPDQPRIPVGILTRIRHYRGLTTCASRLTALLRRYPFRSFRDLQASA